jgi:hypothetical protein
MLAYGPRHRAYIRRRRRALKARLTKRLRDEGYRCLGRLWFVHMCAKREKTPCGSAASGLTFPSPVPN